jgi:Coenzyme PQQ synthesis protein D (PqqD)
MNCGGTVVGTPAIEIPAEVLYREVGGEMVLLHLGTEEYFALNGVGAAIVRSLLELPWEQALAELSDTYDVDPSTLEDDARDLVGALTTAGLARPTG